MPEPPLDDRELRLVRGMIDEHQRELYREQWFAGAWGRFVRAVAVLSAAAVLVAACLEIARAF